MLKFFYFVIILQVAVGYETTQDNSWQSPGLIPKILLGKPTNIKDVPYQVAVFVGNQFSCGGVILGPKTILTAAHCVHNISSDQINIVAGVTKLKSKCGQKLPVSNVTVCDVYKKNPNLIDCDIALLFLLYPLKYNEKVQPTVITSVPATRGLQGIASGWGVPKFGTVSLYLRSTKAEVIDHYQCQSKYPYPHITNNMLCGTHRTSKGDSGGPFVANNQLIGITSFGISYFGSSIDVFADVYNLREFIKDKIV